MLFIKNIYNLILENTHSIMINDIEVVTLGHGYSENEVIYHPYYGS